MAIRFAFPYRRTPRLDAQGNATSWAVDESARIVAENGGPVKRVYPFDQWEVPPAVLARAKKLCILKVPLLGQNYGPGSNGWCGRTSSSMLYNWYKLLSCDDPKSAYITHWTGRSGLARDLRTPDGEVAFDHYQLRQNFNDLTFPDPDRSLLPPLAPASDGARAAEVQRLLSDNDYLIAKFWSCGLLSAIDARNPAVFATALANSSFNADGLQHIVLVIGYFIIEEDGRDELFVVIADPATPPNATHNFGLGEPIAPKDADDSRFIEKLKPSHNYIRLLASGDDWTAARGTVTAIRARALFQLHPSSPKKGVLYCDHGTHSGGHFFHKKDPTLKVPPDLVAEVTSSISLPFDEKGCAGSPQRYFFLNERLHSGFFPIGQHQNIHTGIHLLAPKSSGAPTPAADQPDCVPVRALAPGYVVALRLPGFAHLPDPQGEQDEEKRDDAVEPNELARQLTGSDNGFVLIRHEVAQVIASQGGGSDEKPPSRVFYSLCMHLRAPRFDPTAQAGFERDIAWLSRLIQRYGSITVVDPRSPRFRERRWLAPTDDVAARLDNGGTYQVYADRLGNLEQLELEPDGDGGLRPLVCLREPEVDLKDAYSRLQRNQVVTFDVPFLRIQAGDIVGVIDRKSNFGRGFLHWEVLTPGEGSMKDLLDFLNDLMPEDARLPGDFFKETKESAEDNCFEADELKSVVDSLPDCDKVLKSSLSTPAAGRLLRMLMSAKSESPGDQLAFDTAAKGKPFFASEVRIANYQDLAPAKSYPLTLTFSGGAFEKKVALTYDGSNGITALPVEIPAGTTRVKVASGIDLFIDPGDVELRAPDKSKFFQNLVQARWRNTVICHLNEWTKPGLKTTLETRFGAGEILRKEWRPKGVADDKEIPIDQYVDSVAWWGINSVAQAPHDLFGDKAGQLPAACKVESAHPVTLAWLLRLLEEAGKAKVLLPPAWHGENAEKAAHLGWAPEVQSKPRHRVGEPLHFIAIQKEEPDADAEVEVKVELSLSGKKVIAGSGKFIRGLYSEAVATQFWGKATLGIAGQGSVAGLEPGPQQAPPSQSAGGTTPAAPAPSATQTVEVATPKLLEGEAPHAFAVARDDRGVVRISFAGNCPLRLSGWVVFKAESGAVSTPKASIAAVAELALPWAAGADVKLDGDVIASCADGVSVSKSFKYGEYREAAKPNPPRVTVSLVRAVQKLRDMTEGRGMALGNLAADGRSIELTLANRPLGEKSVEPTKALWAFFDRWVDGAKSTAGGMGADLEAMEVPEADRARKRPVVKLVDRQDSSAGGEMEVSFPLSAAYSAAEDLAGPNDSVAKLRVGFRFFNGLVPSEAHRELGWDKVTEKAVAGPVDAWTSTPLEVPLMPHIGAPKFSLVENTSLGRVTVELLGGDQRFWNAAQPKIKVTEGLPRGATPEPPRAVAGSVGRWVMAYTFPMTVEGFKRGDLSFRGKTDKAAVFRGRQVPTLLGPELQSSCESLGSSNVGPRIC